MVSAVTEIVDSISQIGGGSDGEMAGEVLLQHRFTVEVVGILTSTVMPITGFFTEVEGLEAEVELIEYQTVTIFGEAVTQKIPGQPKWDEVTLKRGVTDGMGFWAWNEIVQKGFVELARSSVTITLYDLESNPWAQWDLDKAWPVKVSGPSLNAEANEVAVEEIVLVHEGLRRIDFGLGGVMSMLTDFL